MTGAPRPILLLSNHGDIVGGGEISLLALLRGLDRTRWLPRIVVPSEGAVATRCRALGLTVHTIPFPPLRWPCPSMVRSVTAIRRLIREAGTALVHANGSRAMFYGGLGARLSQRPAIWHVRVADRDAVLDRLLGRLARAVVVNSHAVAHRFDWLPPRKLHCIHNGVDLSGFFPRRPPAGLRRSLGIPDSAPVVASVGRFVAYKGYNHLLDAARIIGTVLPLVHWILVGDGELRGELEEQCRQLGLAPQTHFTGWREDVADLLALSDLFVLPSLGEHFGRVLIEAMAMAKPVVATNAGGVPEIVEHGRTGLLVPPASPRALAEAVVDLMRDPARASEFGQVGRRLAESRFSLERHVDSITTLYEALAATSRHSRDAGQND